VDTAIRASGATRVWAYFDNDRNRFAIKNARTFRRLLVGEFRPSRECLDWEFRTF
jgi:hypothetical protein